MTDNKNVKELCKSICDELSDQLFCYVFEGKLILGNVVDLTDMKLYCGTENNLVGDPVACANLFYKIILMNVAQIKAFANLTSEEAAYEVSKRLIRDKDLLEIIEAPLIYESKTLHKGGNA